jgi:hypothetical protein
MDRTSNNNPPRQDWSWLPRLMPTVASLVADKRKEFGAAWVTECWRRGVGMGEPGHFFAAEGALMVGTPASAAMLTQWYELRQSFPGASIVHIAEPSGASHGA